MRPRAPGDPRPGWPSRGLPAAEPQALPAPVQRQRIDIRPRGFARGML